jgi:hypothetical protein
MFGFKHKQPPPVEPSADPTMLILLALVGLLSLALNLASALCIKLASKKAASPARALAKAGAADDHEVYTQVPTMEEAALAIRANRDSRIKAKTARDILDDLKAGNTRFWTGEIEHNDISLVERRTLIHGQVPKVMVLGCADSRVPIEIVFDQGLGERRVPAYRRGARKRLACGAGRRGTARIWLFGRGPQPAASLADTPCPVPPARASRSAPNWRASALQAMCLSCATRATCAGSRVPAQSTTRCTTWASS